MICFFTLQTLSPVVGLCQVVTDSTSYIVSEIIVHSSADEKRTAEKELLVKARLAAFSYLKMYIGNQDLNPTDLEIDSFMVGFTPRKISFTGDEYVGYFDVIFDRKSVDAYVVKNTFIQESVKQGSYFVVSVGDDFSTWRAVQKTLRGQSLNFKVLIIEMDYVEFLVLGQTHQKVCEILASKNLVVVPNNGKFFIKFASS